MITAGYIWDSIQNLVRLHGNDDLDDIKNQCQLAYYDIWGQHPWYAGRAKSSITFSATAGALLPGDLCGIEQVYDSSNEYDYYPGSEAGDHELHTWFYTDPVTDALAILTNINVESLANTWTGGTWSASYIGEYVRFGKEPGVYLITAENTFTPRYYGPRLNLVKAMIRPAGTKKIAAYDEDNDRVGAALDVYYWKYPAPLYDETQDILLPSARVLELGTAIRMLGEKDRRDNAADRMRTEYYSALEMAKAMNPRIIRAHKPVNAQGYSAFDMTHR
jgi:hypothetical protein